MSPSPELEPLPPALSSMWRLCKLGYRHEPRLMVVSFVLSQLAALPDALLALWLALLGKGYLEHRTGLMQGAAIGLGVSTAATWFLRTVSTRVQRRFRDKVTIALESHVARLQATVATVAHHERPEYLDRLSMLRNQVFVLDHMYMSLFRRWDGSCGWGSPWRCWRRFILRCCCWRSLPCRPSGPPPGGRRWSARRRSEAPRAIAWRATCSPSPPPRPQAKKCGSPASASAWSAIAARRGIAGTGRWRQRVGARRSGMRWDGRSSAWPMWAR